MDSDELGRDGGANAENGGGWTTDAARGGGGVEVLAAMPARLGEAVCARAGGGGGALGPAVASAPALRVTISTSQ